jgi:hypothetical protein
MNAPVVGFVACGNPGLGHIKGTSGMSTNSDQEWAEQMLALNSKNAAFKSLAMTPRSTAKKHNTLITELQAVPRKTTARTMMEDTEEPTTPTHHNTRPTEKEKWEVTEIIDDMPNELSPATNSMRGILQIVITMIKCAKDRVANQKSHVKKEVIADYDEIVTFMGVIHAIEDEMTNVKHELQDIKQTVKASIKASEKATECNWVAIAEILKAPPIHHGTHLSKRDIDEKSQQKQTKWRLERAKFEVTLTAEETKDTQK